MNQKPKIIALTGPSATGKSALAVRLAKEINGEIISADSRYVYKFLDIATAKPTQNEMSGIKHHLVDICEVTQEYTAGLFVKDAQKSIEEIIQKGKVPIVTGGTGLYFRALSGQFDIPEVEPDRAFRLSAESIPNDVLYAQLKEKYPELATKIHPNNKIKIIRALEIANSGLKMTSKESPYKILWLGLNAENRDFLYKRAEFRVEQMFDTGLLNEAEFLFKKYPKNKILMNTIGLKELYSVLFENTDIKIAKEEIKKNTRHYIKRQISWFNADKTTNWISIDENFDYFKTVTNFYNNFKNDT